MTNKRRSGKPVVPRSGSFWRGVFAGLDGSPHPIVLMESTFSTVPHGTNAIAGEPDTIDWYATFRYPIGSQSSTKQGLRRRCEALEKIIAPHLTKGILVVLESTTYPGTTDEDLRQVLEKGSGLRADTEQAAQGNLLVVFEVLGIEVEQLQRTQIGSVKLAELLKGKWRTLTESEIKSLLSSKV